MALIVIPHRLCGSAAPPTSNSPTRADIRVDVRGLGIPPASRTGSVDPTAGEASGRQSSLGFEVGEFVRIRPGEATAETAEI